MRLQSACIFDQTDCSWPLWYILFNRKMSGILYPGKVYYTGEYEINLKLNSFTVWWTNGNHCYMCNRMLLNIWFFGLYVWLCFSSGRLCHPASCPAFLLINSLQYCYAHGKCTIWLVVLWTTSVLKFVRNPDRNKTYFLMRKCKFCIYVVNSFTPLFFP